MHKDVARSLYPNPEMYAIEGLGEPTGAMEEPVLWLPYSPDNIRILGEEGYVLSEELVGFEALKFGKLNHDRSTWTLADSIRDAAIEGDVAVVSKGKGRDRQFSQVWFFPNSSVDPIA